LRKKLLKVLKEQLGSLKEKEVETLSQATEITTQSQTLMSINLQLQSKVLKTMTITVDQELSKLTSAQAQAQMAFIKVFRSLICLTVLARTFFQLAPSLLTMSV
jgi:dynactin 1